MYKKILLLLSISCMSLVVWSQKTKDSFVNIKLIEDPNLSMFYPAKPDLAAGKSTPQSNKGFRVQIYDGNSRDKASTAKANFMKKYPGVRSYLKFHNPQYRVRVGDFATREEAEQYQEKIKKDFAPTMVIPDVINTATKSSTK